MFKTLNKNDILRGLESILPKDIIKVDEPLKRYTYTETGGEADFYLSAYYLSIILKPLMMQL